MGVVGVGGHDAGLEWGVLVGRVVGVGVGVGGWGIVHKDQFCCWCFCQQLCGM